MPIIRQKHYKNFTIVPNRIIQDESLSMRDKGLLLSLLMYPDDWDFSIEHIVKTFKNDGRDAVRKSLKNLENAGYVQRKRVRDSLGRVGMSLWTITDTPNHKNECNPSWISYIDYLQSETWKEKRNERLKKDNYCCQLCGKKEKLEVHHLTYARLGNEEMEDLVTLCHACHEKQHKKVKQEGA